MTSLASTFAQVQSPLVPSHLSSTLLSPADQVHFAALISAFDFGALSSALCAQVILGKLLVETYVPMYTMIFLHCPDFAFYPDLDVCSAYTRKSPASEDPWGC